MFRIPDITYPFVVGTIGDMIAAGEELSVHCQECNSTKRVNLVALSRRLGIGHTCLDPDLRPYFYCSECRAAGRRDRNFNFLHHACAVPHSILALRGKAGPDWMVRSA
jgi:hypothetical protein